MNYICHGCETSCRVQMDGMPNSCLKGLDMQRVGRLYESNCWIELPPAESPHMWVIEKPEPADWGHLPELVRYLKKTLAACEDVLPRCKCGDPVDDTDDPDEKYCLNCKITGAELRLGDK